MALAPSARLLAHSSSSRTLLAGRLPAAAGIFTRPAPLPASTASQRSAPAAAPCSPSRRIARSVHSTAAPRATSLHEVQSMRASPSQSQRPHASSHPAQANEPLRPEQVGAISQQARASQEHQQAQLASQAAAAAAAAAASSSPQSLPTLGYTKDNLPTKTDPTLAFFVGILMRDGKKAQSNRTVMNVLAHLNEWTSSPPLPLFTEAITRASPLVRMQTSKSGGKITQIPIPLNPRQSTHRGIKAIIEASKKRSDRYLSTRLAKEVIAVLEGSSSVLARKEEQHKVAMANRANASVRI